MTGNDPLKNRSFKAPGILEMLKRDLLGKRRPLDCIQVEVTSFCAGRCTYCPHTTMAETWKSRHMEADVFAALWQLGTQINWSELNGDESGINGMTGKRVL